MVKKSPSQPRVEVLLCTLQSGTYLEGQVASIVEQSHKNWRLWISDDGSTDGTWALLEKVRRKHGADRIRLGRGPRKGFVPHYLALTRRAVGGPLWAWADHDDIWEKDHLERALHWHRTIEAEKPALYAGRTRYIGEQNEDLGFSAEFRRPPSFENALVQSIGGANTMVFNTRARDLLLSANSDGVVSHDWWAYLLVAGAGGAVHYDPYPGVRYRQHGSNLVGANTSLAARFMRARMVSKGVFSDYLDRNTSALVKNIRLLSPENRETLAAFMAMRSRGPVGRLSGLLRLGIRRQTTLGNLGLAYAALMGRL